MSLVSFTPVTDGSTATAAGVNTPLSTIFNDYNGNITNANISASAAIDFSKVSGGSSTSLGAWQSFTPTLTNLTINNGTTVAKYCQVGKLITVRYEITWGSTTSSAGNVSMTLPVTASSDYTALRHSIGTAEAWDNSASTNFPLTPLLASSTTVALRTIKADSTFAYQLVTDSVNATQPMTWAVSDVLTLDLLYEAA